MGRPSQTLEHVMRHVIAIPESGCWLWELGCDKDGYGKVTVGGKFFRVHRYMYEQLKGPVQPGLVTDHLCRVRCCCNPDHLEMVTNQTNIDRGIPSNGNTKKTHCPQGHAYTEDNIYWLILDGEGPRRKCRICHCAEGKRRRARRKAERLAMMAEAR